MDAGLVWTAVGAVAGGVTVLIGVPQLVIVWLDRRDKRGDGRARLASVGGMTGGGVEPPWGRLVSPGLRGREHVLRQLRRALRGRQRIQVIVGIGGAGKSAVALALCAHACRRLWWQPSRQVWWVSAADRVSLTAGLISVARQAGGSDEDLRAIVEGTAEAPGRLGRC